MTLRPCAIEMGIIDRWQKGLPLVAKPYAEMARREGLSEQDVMQQLAHLLATGVIARIGATVRPNTAGASTLAAMSVPAEQLETVAEIVNQEPGVNHNYERDHALNLWFVATGANRPAVDAALSRIEARSGHGVIDLPLTRSYFIDLGFPLHDREGWKLQRKSDLQQPDEPVVLLDNERRLLIALQDGLALVPRPYHALGKAVGLSEDEVVAQLESLLRRGIITRLGLIVRHRELGFAANAMAVWDIDDAKIDSVGAQLACEPAVTLCYRRPRRPPVWPYNLFCMVHGRERAMVEREVERLALRAGIADRPRAVLFSNRRFKQRGASLTAA